MTDRAFGVRIRSALLILMALGPRLTNVELQPWLPKGIERKDRQLLNERGLIVSTRTGATYTHELTGAGWGWCLQELSSGKPPPRAGSLGGALYAVLLGLARHVERSGAGLADLFDATSEATTDTAETPGGTVGIEEVIRARYRELAGFSNDWVRLADLRPRLDGLDRAEVDEALVAMNRLPDVNLAPEPVQSMLSEADHRAAVEVGGRANHLLAVDLDG